MHVLWYISAVNIKGAISYYFLDLLTRTEKWEKKSGFINPKPLKISWNKTHLTSYYIVPLFLLLNISLPTALIHYSSSVPQEESRQWSLPRASMKTLSLQLLTMIRLIRSAILTMYQTKRERWRLTEPWAQTWDLEGTMLPFFSRNIKMNDDLVEEQNNWLT